MNAPQTSSSSSSSSSSSKQNNDHNNLSGMEDDDQDADIFDDDEGGEETSPVANNKDNCWSSRIELLKVCSGSSKLQKKAIARRPPIGGKWSAEEDERLREIVNAHGAENWRKVASLLGSTRSDVQCLHRWNKVLRPGLQKGSWSTEEDRVVRDAVLNHGVGRVLWSEIAAQLPGRLGKQCRERWFNHLDPAINKGEWLANEDRILYEGQYHFGNRWCEISKLLPGRTENAVKNRWNSSAMRRWLSQNDLEPGSGVALEDISDPQGMQRVLNAFITALSASGVGISKEATALLLSDIGSELQLPEGLMTAFTNANNVASSSSSSSSSSVPRGPSSTKKTEAKTAKAAGATSGEGKGGSSTKKRKHSATTDNALSIPSGAGGAADPVVSSSKPPKKRRTKEVQEETGQTLDATSSSAAKAGRAKKGKGDGTSSSTEPGSDIDKTRRGRLPLPSHLRPTAINTSLRPEGGGDQDELVEILSNLKSSPRSEGSDMFSGSASYFDAASVNGKGGKRKGAADGGNRMESPTDRALNNVRLELTRRGYMGMSSSGAASAQQSSMTTSSPAMNGAEVDTEVPFQLLPFFRLLESCAQRDLMQQLLDHFHNTAASAMKDDNHSNDSIDVQYSYDLTGGQLTLRSPRGVVVHNMLNNNDSNGALDDTTASSFNAAVNVALKCATREASFEDVLSWLTQTDEGRFSSSMKVADTPTHASTNSSELHGDSSSSSSIAVATKSPSNKGIGLSLPSHLRPPAIVTSTTINATTANIMIPTHNAGNNNNTCRDSVSEQQHQHDELVEILSAFKSNHNSPSNAYIESMAAAPSSSSSSSSSSGIVRPAPSNTTNLHHYDGPASSLADSALVRVQQELLRRSARDVVSVVNDPAAAASSSSTIRSRRNSDGNGAVPLRVEFDVDPNDGCHAGQGTGRAKDDGDDNNSLEDSVVPFQLLPFFGLLNDYAQRSLMRQLVDHFQQTTFTPRNAGALLATPRFNDMQLLESSLGMGGADDMICDAANGSGDAFTYNISDGHLSLGSPRNGGTIDPHCFEEGFIAAEGFLGGPNSSSSSCRNSFGSNSGGNNVKQKKSKEPQRVRDTVQAFLDAPVNAAVNVALKCATREASFEEVLSWLLAASTGEGSGFSGDNGNAQHATDTYTTNSLLSCAFPTR